MPAPQVDLKTVLPIKMTVQGGKSGSMTICQIAGWSPHSPPSNPLHLANAALLLRTWENNVSKISEYNVQNFKKWCNIVYEFLFLGYFRWLLRSGAQIIQRNERFSRFECVGWYLCIVCITLFVTYIVLGVWNFFYHSITTLKVGGFWFRTGIISWTFSCA